MLSSSICRVLIGERQKMKRNLCTYSAAAAAHVFRKLEGKVALITGAASGIGRETAIKFVENGAKLVIADIDHDQGKSLATQLGKNASFIGCDVKDESAVSAAVDHAVSHFGRLDIMFNNAGIACRTSPSIVDLDLANYDRVMAINVRGVVAGIKHASRVMIPQRSGSILCTSSITGIMGGLAQHTYSISKFSIVGIVKSLTAELCRNGIRINCISPFAIPTRFVMEEITGYYPGLDSEKITDMIHKIGQLEGAYCEASDIANAALFLASDEAKYISGHNLVVDGGFTSTKSLNLPTPDQLN
ncbi:secoisolariciresinol dehydrogenase isoform X1 [Impatiens glandulifera]|uniref:secoisolariciresinol dehydrogenase isoform X1 n=2 Tax=Impatiens glandulifera TaxID=253017 RepID=UPI001FB0DCCA|nr:secoisolariciresinol dehydrogenase isoform X1 [Impatiens glandulifera]